MRRSLVRSELAVVLLLATTTWTACASGGGGRPGTFTRLVIGGEEIRDVGYETAYDAIVNHREIITLGGEIGFKGGDENAFGRAAEEWYIPMLVVDGNYHQIDAVTTRRRIDAVSIVSIRLYKSSMVPPEYRRPEARGGVIEVTTR